METNKFPNFQKCGEILIDIKSKNKKNKIYVFHCTFCNLECDQLKKFSLHIGEEHLNDFGDILKETELKFEAEPEEIKLPSFADVETSDIKVFESPIENKKNVNPDPLDTVAAASSATKSENLNCEVKYEIIEHSFDESAADMGVMDGTVSMSDSDKETYDKSDSDDDYIDVPTKKRKTNKTPKKGNQNKRKESANDTSSDEESKDAECNFVVVMDDQQISLRQLRDTFNVLDMPTNEFVSNFHVSKSIFLMLLETFQRKMAPAFRSSKIRPDIKLTTFLRFLATGNQQTLLGKESVSSTGRSSVNRIIVECLELFENWICAEWIKMPTLEEEQQITEAFFERTGFPGVVGCLDGTHIRLKSPGDNIKRLYKNGKGFYSINAMMQQSIRASLQLLHLKTEDCYGDPCVHLSDFEDSPYSSDEESYFTEDEEVEHFWNADDIPRSSLTKTNIVKIPKENLIGKNQYKWSSNKQNSHISDLPNVQTIRGPTQNCENLTEPLFCFKKFFNDAILNEIVQCTNAKFNAKTLNHSVPLYKETNSTEIQALLGLLIFSAIMRDNHFPVSELFDSKYSSPRYASVMSGKRFALLVEAMRFEDKSKRIEGVSDKLAPIRKVWDLFIENCQQNYVPGPYLTIGEQFLAYSGKSPFKMFKANTPAKYGFKVLTLCDSGSSYMLNAIPYWGKGCITTSLPLAEYFVTELSKPVYGSIRNITMNKWFTSVSLAKLLVREPYKLTLVGNFAGNKPEIPAEFRNNKNRPIDTSMFCYDHELTLLSYKPKRKKIIYLLSSCNEEGSVNISNKKPFMLEFYNKTKGSVDRFDKMCSSMTCSRKTNRWAMCLFYGMINMAVTNSYIIYCHNVLESKKKPLSRKEFAKKLYYDLVRDHINERTDTATLQSKLKGNIPIELKSGTKDDAAVGGKTCKRRINCKLCPYKKRRMTTTVCYICKRSICREHQIVSCTQCRHLVVK